MTIKLDITCDRCGFKSEDRFDFGDKHFSRIVMDGSDRTEYFHLCKKCQDEINNQVVVNLPEIILQTNAKCQYEGVELGSGMNGLGVIMGITVHRGVII